MNAPCPVLRLAHVSRRLAQRCIVDDLSLDLHRGEVLGLLGVNGAGKSTTLRMISGTLAPSAGQVQVNGRDLQEHAHAARREIGYLPENPPLHDSLQVGEYLQFCARLHGLKGTAVTTAVERVLEACELGDMRRRVIGLLSKGYRQRVGLAQAIVHEPDLIILDEPASGLDPLQTIRLRELIARLAGDHAVILSTHVLADVTACCDRVAILHEGRLRHVAKLSELESTAAVRLRLAQPVTSDLWANLPIIASANPVSEREWRLTLAPGATAAAVSAAVSAKGLALEELRADHDALEAIFVRIASGATAQEAAA